MAMREPPHPGRRIKTALGVVGMNITEGAEHLGVSRNTRSRVISGWAGISPKMAIRLAKVFDGTADIGVRMQASYALAQAMEHEKKINVTPLPYPHEQDQGPLAHQDATRIEEGRDPGC